MLSPLPQPGLVLFSGFTAQRPETFFIKSESGSSIKAQYQVFFASPIGSVGTPFMRLGEEEKNTTVFRQPNGQEAMRIVKQKHHWSGKSPEYHGYTPDGREIWHLTLKEGLLKTEYVLTLESGSMQFLPSIEVESKTSIGGLGLLVNGNLAMAGTKPNVMKWNRENVVNVAQGMVILLALGLNWIRYDKQDMDAKATGKGIGDAGGFVAAAISG